MINKSIGYRSSDGAFHESLEKAQEREISNLIMGDTPLGADEATTLAEFAVRNADKIIDILTMKPNSLPKARKINGGTKKRQPKHIAEQFAMPLQEAKS